MRTAAIVRYLWYIHYVVKAVVMVNTEHQLMRNAEDAIRRVFTELGRGTIQIRRKALLAGVPGDAILDVTSDEAQFEIAIDAKAENHPTNGHIGLRADAEHSGRHDSHGLCFCHFAPSG